MLFRSISQIENVLFCDKYDQVDDKKDYLMFLSEIGINEKLARVISENDEDQIKTKQDSSDIYINESFIQGLGVFASKEFLSGETIGFARIENKRTLLGRYANHSKDPNCVFEICDNSAKAIAIKNIKCNQEITVDYRNA